MSEILELLESDGFALCQATSSEWAGPCPSCGGEDRFRVWPESGRWWCRSCNKKGDTIDYLQQFRGLLYPEACQLLGRELPKQESRTNAGKSFQPALTQPWKPKPAKQPGEAWQKSAAALTSLAHAELLKRPDCLQWLEKERGITLDTVKARCMGWIHQDQFQERKAWGLPEELNEKGNPKKVFLPAGLLIPCHRGPSVDRLKIRRSEPDEAGRYFNIPGGSMAPLVLGACRKVLVVVESELDAILLYQDAGSIAGAVALGSAVIRPDQVTAEVLGRAENVMVALDSDAAGGKEAWHWWRKNFTNSTRWPVAVGKDPTEAKIERGLCLRSWIMAGLPEVKRPGKTPPGDTSPTKFLTGEKRTGEKRGKDSPPSIFHASHQAFPVAGDDQEAGQATDPVIVAELESIYHQAAKLPAGKHQTRILELWAAITATNDQKAKWAIVEQMWAILETAQSSPP